jgi:hypothetical protein
MKLDNQSSMQGRKNLDEVVFKREILGSHGVECEDGCLGCCVP